MSLLNQPDAVPSRILAIYRCLLTTEGYRLPRADLEDLLSPRVLRKGEDGSMIGRCITEALGIGLLQADGAEVRLTPDVVIDVATGLDPFRELILQLLAASPSRSDLLDAMAWFVNLPAHFAKATNDRIQELVSDLPPEANRLGFTNDSRADMLIHWSTFLGCGRRHLGAKNVSFVLVPDLTRILRRHVSAIFQEFGPSVKLEVAREHLCKLSPIWPGGESFRRVEGYLPKRGPRELAWAESMAWHALDDANILRLRQHDIENFQFDLGSETAAYNIIERVAA